jgi:uncharacterized Fe-S center protein
LANSKIEGKEGEIFTSIHPNIDPLRQLIYAEQIGLGSMSYELIKL